MYPTIVEQIDIAAGATSNVTNIPISDSANTLLGLLPLFFALGILMVALNLVMSMLRDVGLFGGGSSERDYNDEDGDDDDLEEECEYCEKDILEEDERTCNECEENICINCRVRFGEYNYCKECYKEVKKDVEKKDEKIKKEEVKPIITKEKTSFEKKSKFEEKTKYD